MSYAAPRPVSASGANACVKPAAAGVTHYGKQLAAEIAAADRLPEDMLALLAQLPTDETRDGPAA